MKITLFVFIISLSFLRAQHNQQVDDKSKIKKEDSLLILNGAHKIILNSRSLSNYHVNYAGVLATDSNDKRFLTWNLSQDAVWIIREKNYASSEKFIDPLAEIGRMYLFNSESVGAFKIKINGNLVWMKIIWNPKKNLSDDLKNSVVRDMQHDGGQ